MKTHQIQHPFYSDINLHTLSLYVYIINNQGKVLVNQRLTRQSVSTSRTVSG